MSLPTHKIAGLNDLLRTTFLTGKVILTEGICALPDSVREDVLTQVRCFSDFGPDNDPYGEHDFGAIDHPAAGMFDGSMTSLTYVTSPVKIRSG